MKHKKILVVVASSVCLWGQAMAQTKSTTGIQTKPIAHSSTVSQGPTTSPNVHSVNIILRRQMRQVQKDRKSGKLTETQAKAAWEFLKSVRRQELEFFKQNGQKEVTVDQKNQLQQRLGQTTASN